MGWEDRDWAKWDDRERAHFLGTAAPARAPRRVAVACAERRTELTLLAMLVSVAGSFAVAHFHLYQRLAAPQPRPAPAPVVYGAAVTDATGQTLVCTAVVRRPGENGSCTAGQPLRQGQRFVAAGPLPVGAACSSLVADQRLGRWICVAR